VHPCLRAPVLQAQQPAQQPDTALARSQERLADIRRERERLQGEMDRLRGRVHNLSSDLTNIDRQMQISGAIVSELNIQVAAIGSRIDKTTENLIVAQDALAEKRAILGHRLTEISKRGPLHTFQVLLAAESFGDLISRYKYLYLVSRQDRQLVGDVEALRYDVSRERDDLLNQRSNLASRRDERTEETARLQELENQRQQSLLESQRDQRRMELRLQQLARDEIRLNDLIAAVELRRRRAAAANPRTPPAAARITTTDMGRLDWPVEGDIVYNFGSAAGPGATTIRWNGIGIGAAVGTPVKVVAAGTVRLVAQMSLYGLCVLVDHNGGLYSLYCQLQSADVRQDQTVERGAVIGRSGGASSDQGPHLHFEIRGNGGLQHIDPVQWLRRRR
jgi:septal ring factor EnvC (AmiA/AmiB activator)